MSEFGCLPIAEHTGTTDDTLLLDTATIPRRGFIVGILITATGAGGSVVITLYDTMIATGAGAYSSEPVIWGPFEAKTADSGRFMNLKGCEIPFTQGIGVDMDQTDGGIQVFWRS